MIVASFIIITLALIFVAGFVPTAVITALFGKNVGFIFGLSLFVLPVILIILGVTNNWIKNRE